MALEHAILGFLAERARSGYDLKTRCFDGPISGFWTADQAQIYRTLDRLAKGSAVTSRRRRQSGRPDRRIYELTPAGQIELDEWVATSRPLPPLRDPLLIQLWFAAQLEDSELARVLTSARDERQARLDGLREDVASVTRERLLSDRERAVRLLALNGAIAGERSAIDWLDDAIGELERDDSGGRRTSRQRPLFGTT